MSVHPLKPIHHGIDQANPLMPPQVMTYDLMNRRSNETDHHTGVEGSMATVDTYIERGMTPGKMVLGFAFYAKWFTTQAGVECAGPTGCPTAELETPDGADTGLSGAVTFEKGTYAGDFLNAVENGQTDDVAGGQWYWDASKEVYWTWDTPELVAEKFDRIVKPRKLGGVMAWSLAQDSYDWSHFNAMSEGVKSM